MSFRCGIGLTLRRQRSRKEPRSEHGYDNDGGGGDSNRSQLSGWLDTVAGFNPVTYLEGLRSLVAEGWQWDDLGKALLAVAIVGALSMSLCFAALRGRIRHA